MERDEMPKTLCRSGCGFYGSSATDGLCSICFKDALKKKCVPNQASSTGSSSGGATPINSSSSSSTSSTTSSSTSSSSSSSSGSSTDPPPTTTNISQTAILTLSGVETSSSTATVTASAIIDVVTQSIPGPSVSIAQPPEEEEDKKPTKTKNRCDTCKKKVGLTGFDCRCGGIFCSLHRYSDKHDCSFNYREQGAAEIRRNNPQIMGQKINKI